MRVSCLLILACGSAESRTRWIRFTATAYAQEGTTADGTHTHENWTVAADPAVLPLGTKIQVRGAGAYSGMYMVRDSGPKVNGRQIDIYIKSVAEAKQFGKKEVRVRILKRAPVTTASK